MFALKKILGNLMMPLSFSLLLLLTGLVLLWFSRRQAWGKALVSLAAVILIVTSLPYAPARLNISLERNHPALLQVPGELDYVVVLGHGHRSDPYLPPRLRLSTASYYRLTEGLRVLQANPGATLLLSGYEGSDPVSNAETYRLAAIEHGIPSSRIRTFPEARDTAEEAALIAPIIQNRHSALVTSASHMPRALALFRNQGATPLPAPTDFNGKQPQQPLVLHERLPSAGNLSAFTVAWHEIIGSYWRKVRD